MSGPTRLAPGATTRTAPPPIAPRPTRGPLPPAALRARTRRRQAVLFALACLALLAISARLVYWQIGLRQELANRAAAEALAQINVPAGRGTIRDANGVILALSVTEDSVIADPDVIRQARALDHTVAALAPIVGLTAAQVRARLDVPGAYVQLEDATGQPLLLTPAQSQAFTAAQKHGDLTGVTLFPVVHRVYPGGALASQVLGFVRQSDGTGQYGVEAAYDRLLGGQSGVLTTAVDSQGDPLATGPRGWTPPVPGADLTLTLDATIQDMAERGLADAIARTGADGGSVVILDPRTGAILALANQPAFNPNAYATASLADFNDPAVDAVFDPGSVMKAMTMAAGIDTGVITPNTTFDDRGVVTVDGVPLHNWGDYAYGTESMTQVLQHSANVGAVFVAQRLGVARFQAYMAAFGYGAPTGVDLPAETPGLFPRPGDPGEAELAAAEQSFGESIGVTPLQLASAYAALANGGVLMRPYIVQCVTADGGRGTASCVHPHVARQVVSAAAAWTVTRMLVDSALTSEAQMDLIQGYSIAAKTGTSTPDPHDPSLTYATVAGYAPATNPRFVIVVKLDHPRTSIFGGAAAGPLWRSLAQQLFIYYRIPPDIPAGTT